MADERWTPKRIEARLEEAAEVLRRLPEPRIQGYFSTWPVPVRDYWEAFGWSDVVARRPCPTPAAITRMEEALEWLAWVSPDDARLLWLRAERVPWRVVCAKIGVSRATAWRHWVAALMMVGSRLKSQQNNKSATGDQSGRADHGRDQPQYIHNSNVAPPFQDRYDA